MDDTSNAHLTSRTDESERSESSFDHDSPEEAPDETEGETGDDPAWEGPAEGSDAAVSLAFGRNMARLRELRGLSQHRLAAEMEIGSDSIRDYELGKYRPKQPKLWLMAQALDVMPISLGPGAVRGAEPPIPVELLLRKKGSRALRLQSLVELLAGGSVSAFCELGEMASGRLGAASELYALAAQDAQLTDVQLEGLFDALPQVRRSWVLSGDGEALHPQVKVVAPQPKPIPEAAEPRAPFPALPPAPGLPAPSLPSLSLPRPSPTVLPATPFFPGQALYLGLGNGQVVEVGTVELDGAPAISGFRLLAAGGEFPALTTGEQLNVLYAGLCQFLGHSPS